MRSIYFIFFVMVLGLPALVAAQSGGTFTITRSVVAGGGDSSTGGTFVINGTIGEPVAGTISNGGTFSLGSGFWASAAALRRTPFDLDGDAKTDLAIFRPNAPTGAEWWWLKSGSGGNAAVQFGTSIDRLTPVDFTGDGKTDVAFWRPSTGQWFVLRSEDFSFFAFPFGTNGDTPIPADFDGDGKADAAVFRESAATWYINRSSGGTDIVGFGALGD